MNNDHRRRNLAPAGQPDRYTPIDWAAMAGLARLLGRGLLSAIFIRAGVRYVVDPSMPAARAAAVLPWLPEPTVVARALAGVHLAGGLAVATQAAPRLGAATLAATLVPVTYVGHGFWREQDAGARAQQLTHFFKNCGIAGGLLILAAGNKSSTPK